MSQTTPPSPARTTTPAQTPAASAAFASRRTIAILAVIMTRQLIAVLDASIVNVAIPSIRTSLYTSGSALPLIVAGYVIAYAVLLVTGARRRQLAGSRRDDAGVSYELHPSSNCELAWCAMAVAVILTRPPQHA